MIGWPPLDLFYYLRERDLPLGIGEYFLMLRAIQMGYGVDPEGQYNLCLRLWAKNSEDQSHIGDYFHLYAQEEKYPQVGTAAQKPISSEGSAGQAAGSAETLGSEAGAMGGISTGTTSGESTEFMVQPHTETTITGGGTVTIRARPLAVSQRSEFNLTGEYYPVTQRQMKQQWRYLRRLQRRGVPTELDIPATVQRAGREGMLFEPVMLPLRANTAELLVLVDRDGSMAPFHDLGNQLIQTAAGAGRLGRFAAYFFHNFPPSEAESMEDEFFLFRLPTLAFDLSMRECLEKFDRDNTSILIFSDAGAARGGRSLERINETVRFLNYLKRLKIYSWAWLNPMPAERWKGTSAEAIQGLVKMFELSRPGLAGLINTLRGSDR